MELFKTVFNHENMFSSLAPLMFCTEVVAFFLISRSYLAKDYSNTIELLLDRFVFLVSCHEYSYHIVTKLRKCNTL